MRALALALLLAALTSSAVEAQHSASERSFVVGGGMTFLPRTSSGLLNNGTHLQVGLQLARIQLVRRVRLEMAYHSVTGTAVSGIRDIGLVAFTGQVHRDC